MLLRQIQNASPFNTSMTIMCFSLTRFSTTLRTLTVRQQNPAEFPGICDVTGSVVIVASRQHFSDWSFAQRCSKLKHFFTATHYVQAMKYTLYDKNDRNMIQ